MKYLKNPMPVAIHKIEDLLKRPHNFVTSIAIVTTITNNFCFG